MVCSPSGGRSMPGAWIPRLQQLLDQMWAYDSAESLQQIRWWQSPAD
jgi:hypothetical protein